MWSTLLVSFLVSISDTVSAARQRVLLDEGPDFLAVLLGQSARAHELLERGDNVL